MDWSNLHAATSQGEKPVPGWLFRDICLEAQRNPQDIPDVAEYVMRCAACDDQNVSLKGCLALHHLADDVPQFREYMQRCPEALAILQDVSAPPPLAITASLEAPEAKVRREAAARALRSCTSREASAEAARKAEIRARCQGFGNYAPPEEEQPRPGGTVERVADLVGGALADTVDDFREKGAVGAVRDGVLDAADLLVDGVGAVWSFLGGRRNAPAPVEPERICRPLGAAPHPTHLQAPGAAGAQVAGPAPSAYAGAFGRGAAGATHSFSPAALQQVGLAAPAPPLQFTPSPLAAAASAAAAPAAAAPTAAAPVAAAPAPATEPEDLLIFEDNVESSSPSSADLISLGGETGAPVAGTEGPAEAVELKRRGNALVKEKRLSDAVKQYEAALSLLAPGSHEPLRAVLFANVALCYLQQQLYRRAVEAATSSMEADAGHAKAHYRRCLAHRALKMHEEARRDFDALGRCKHDMTPAEMQKLSASLEASR